MNAVIRIVVIPIAATRYAAIPNVVDRDATDAVQNAAPSVVLNVVTPHVVDQAARGDFQNAAVLNVALNVVQGVARAVGIQSEAHYAASL